MWTYRARLERVIDGDTLSLAVDLGFSVSIVVSVRLDGVDAPEVRGGSSEIRTAGYEAAAFVYEWCLPREVLDEWPLEVTTSKVRSFARWVGTVRCDGVDLGEALIANGHGVPAE